MKPVANSKILFDSDEISRKISDIAYRINMDYKHNEQPPILLIILNGGMYFGHEIMKRLDCECEIDTICISSYVGQNKQLQPKISKSPQLNYSERNVIIIDDIYDSGQTIELVKQILGQDDMFAPKSIKTCVLCYRKENQKHKELDYKGFVLENQSFVFGFGMDGLNGLYRNRLNIYEYSNIEVQR